MLEGLSVPLVYGDSIRLGMGGNVREQRRPMWTQHEKTILKLLMRQYAGVTEFDPPDIHKHPIKNEMWRLLTARYNSHPNVRKRDTKQLRKAWENLKYRARKLGNEAKGNGTRGTSAGNGPVIKGESLWPLDGISLPHLQDQDSSPKFPHDLEIKEQIPSEDDDDWQPGIDDKNRSWFNQVHTNNKDTPKTEEITCNVSPSDCIGASESNGLEDVISSQGASSADEQFCGAPRGASRTVLSLQPLVTSLVGGALPALLPFLTPNLGPHFPAGCLLPRRFSESEQTRESDHNIDSDNNILDQRNDISNLISSHSNNDTISNIKQALDLSADSEEANAAHSSAKSHFNNTLTDKIAPLLKGNGVWDDSSPPLPPPSDSPFQNNDSNERKSLLKHRIEAVTRSINQQEEKHETTLQLLKLQISNEVSQHKTKMKILQIQLQYWKKKLKFQEKKSNSAVNSCDSDTDIVEENVDDSLVP